MLIHVMIVHQDTPQDNMPVLKAHSAQVGNFFLFWFLNFGIKNLSLFCAMQNATELN